MKKLNIVLIVLAVFCLLLPLSGCEKSPEVFEKEYFEYFNTVSTVYSYADENESDFEENCRVIESILEKYHRLFDIYNEYEGINNLCTLNKNAGGELIELEAELIDFLLYAKELYGVTGGEMNVMMGSVLSLWHKCRTSAAQMPEKASIPSHNDLFSASEHISIDLLEIDAEGGKARIADALASIDVGAVGKGYAAEIVAEYLSRKEVSGYVIDLGGNLRLVGSKPDGGGWTTGITDPFGGVGYAERLILTDTSCVTSGNYERYFELDGVKYHHIIDKDTLYPSEHFVSVTVICRDSGLADALSTALFCMSYEEGSLLVRKLEGVEAIWIKSDGERLCSDGIVNLRAK